MAPTHFIARSVEVVDNNIAFLHGFDNMNKYKMVLGTDKCMLSSKLEVWWIHCGGKTWNTIKCIVFGRHFYRYDKTMSKTMFLTSQTTIVLSVNNRFISMAMIIGIFLGREV